MALPIEDEALEQIGPAQEGESAVFLPPSTT